MYSHVTCDVMKERTLYLLKPSSLIWHLILYLFLLGNKLIIMRKTKNSDQIHTYLMKLKFNKRIWPNSNCRQLYYTKKYFHFVYNKNLV